MIKDYLKINYNTLIISLIFKTQIYSLHLIQICGIYDSL